MHSAGQSVLRIVRPHELLNPWPLGVRRVHTRRRKQQFAKALRRRITAYLENGGNIENAQAIAAHESPRTTKLYDRTGDEITLDEIERITL
jgi:hypothetical protein